MDLQRVPADGTGKTAFVQKGGHLQLMAEGFEEALLKAARGDVSRAKELLSLRGVSKHELRMALSYMAQTMALVIDTAECRQERLDETTCGAMPDVDPGTWEYCPCNLSPGHQGPHVNNAGHPWR